jgi:hypothetical protein
MHFRSSFARVIYREREGEKERKRERERKKEKEREKEREREREREHATTSLFFAPSSMDCPANLAALLSSYPKQSYQMKY